jgi:DNA-binding beta-propeller fold protein YncE
MKKQFYGFVIGLTLLAVSALAQQNQPPLRLIQTIEMPKGMWHFDHFGVDWKGKRLFATFEDHDTVEVFDLVTGKKIQSIGGLKTPHNVLYLPKLNEIVITDGGGTCRFLDSETLKVIRSVQLRGNADFTAYDPIADLFYVTNGGHAINEKNAFISIIDRSGKKLDDIQLGGSHVEFMAMERSGPRIFVNLTDLGVIGVVDRQKRKMIASWPLPNVEDNVPIVLDETHHHLFTVSRKPAELIVFDTDSGKVMTTLPSVGDSDDMSYDAKRQRIYVAGGEGYISVFQEGSSNKFDELAKIQSGPGGKTAIFVPEVNRFYVGVRGEHEDGKIKVYSVQ